MKSGAMWLVVGAPIAAVPIIFSVVHYPLWGWVFVGWIAVDLLINWADFTAEISEFIENVEDE